MSETGWLERAPMRQLIDAAVEKIVARYRIDREAARAMVVEIWSKDQDLRRVAERESSPTKIARTSPFKCASAAARQSIYYKLRRYKLHDTELEALIAHLASLPPGAAVHEREAAAEAIARAHISTRERLATLDAFSDELFSLVGEPRTVLDVGCGFQPLVFPFDKRGRTVELYVAVDKDRMAIAAIEAYAKARGDGRLLARWWELASGWEPIQQASGVDRFDLALLFKLVPVIERQAPALLSMIAQTPGHEEP
jgi:16S rRNA (guanine(1405)-N(7))-methyltransferase